MITVRIDVPSDKNLEVYPPSSMSTCLLQTTSENIVRGEIARGEQFRLWPQCFQLYLTIKLSFMEIFQVFVTMFSKSSAADLLQR